MNSEGDDGWLLGFLSQFYRGEVMNDLRHKRVFITEADVFMGPYLREAFESSGAEVIANTDSLASPENIARAVESAGQFDCMIVNLAIEAPSTQVADVTDSEWHDVFNALVHPIPRLVAAAVPIMESRGGGKIVVIGSASALRGMIRSSTYSAARGAQLAYVQAAGVELARKNILVNGIAQNFVDNPTYFPATVKENPKFQERLRREVPLGRLVSPQEDAQFVVYLCSEGGNCFVGQIFPVCGGWVHR